MSLDLALMVFDHIEGAHVDAMVAAFEGSGGSLVRHHLSGEAAQALETTVVGRPRVPPQVGG